MALLVNQLFTGVVMADTTEAKKTAELEKKLEQSLKQIQLLSERLSQLENAKNNAPASVAATSAPGAASSAPAVLQQKIDQQNARLDKIEQDQAQAVENSVNQASSEASIMGVPLHGFMSVGYTRRPATPVQPDTISNKSGFKLENVDFYMTPNFGDNLKSLMELNFEYTEQGVLTYDLERFEIGYTFNDALTLWAGRFHTPYGEWNTAYHHGHYIQTSIDRPRFVEFEDRGGILPAHSVGLLASGTQRLSAGNKVQYDAFLANGSRIIPASDGNTIGVSLGNQLDFNPVGNDKGSVGVGGRLSYIIGDDITLGVHGMTETINTYDGDNVRLNSTKLNMLGAFYLAELGNWESIGEYYHFNDKDLSGTTGNHSSWAAFAQVSYTFGNIWTPYARVEKASLNQSDNYFASLASGRAYNAQLIGVRYDFTKAAALKVEVQRMKEQEVDRSTLSYNQFRIQCAVKF